MRGPWVRKWFGVHGPGAGKADPRPGRQQGQPLMMGQCPAAAGRKGLRIMGTRLYVGNLPFDVDESQLRTLFQEGGREVSEVKMITDRETGRPRGFAFVEMGSQADVQAAISALNGREVGGRALTVNEAREQAPRGGGFGGGRSRY